MSYTTALELTRAHGLPPEPRPVDPDLVTQEILAHAPPLSRLPSVDLQDEFTEPVYLRGKPLEELISEIGWAAESLKDKRLRLGDHAIALVARHGGSQPAHRAQVLAWIVSETKVDPDELWMSVRVAKQFPEHVRAEFALQSWTWLQWLTDHTAFLGNPAERRPKVLLLAQTFAEGTFAAMKAQVRALRTACEQDSLANQTDDEPPHPALVSDAIGTDAAAIPQRVNASLDRDGHREPLHGEVETDQTDAWVDQTHQRTQEADAASEWRDRTLRAEQRAQAAEQALRDLKALTPEVLTDGLERRLQREQPGTWSETVAHVREHLAAKVGGAL